jgi:hypothetical protein
MRKPKLRMVMTVTIPTRHCSQLYFCLYPHTTGVKFLLLTFVRMARQAVTDATQRKIVIVEKIIAKPSSLRFETFRRNDRHHFELHH